MQLVSHVYTHTVTKYTRITISPKTYFDKMLRILLIISRWPLALYTLATARYMCLY